MLRLLYWVQNAAPEGEAVLPTLDDLGLNATVLLAACAVVRSQPVASRVVTYNQRLQWDVLIKLYGSEGALNQMISSLEGS